MQRAKLVKAGGYFASTKPLSFIRSGCTLLDLVLGGGWALGRIANIVGDKSTGKTLLACEGAANFAREYPKGTIRYAESESAFDPAYAAALGMPLERLRFDHIDTVEALFADLEQVIAKAPRPVLYVIDSLDGLSDKAEVARSFDATNTYGTSKARSLSEMFRRLVSRLAEADVTLLVLSQTRSNLNQRFPGSKAWTRSGGKALDFYCSQILHLQQTSTLYRETKIDGHAVKRAVGISVRMRAEKNKLALPFRQAEAELLFSYGLDDNKACIAFLDEHKALGKLGGGKPAALLKALREPANSELREQARTAVTELWGRIEHGFLPPSSKYG